MQCIYFKDDHDNKPSAEHIFPAALGGLQTLQTDYVSNKANNYFSKIELLETQSGSIALARMIYGPGSRGSNTPPKHIQIAVSQNIETNEFELAYLFMGKPYAIPQLRLYSTYATLTIPPTEHIIQNTIKLKQSLREFKEHTRYCFLQDDRLQKNCILIGHHNNKYYIAAHKRPNTHTIAQKMGEILDSFEQNNPQMQYSKNYLSMHLKTLLSSNTERFFGKICFNALAHLKGKDFVLRKEFDDFRNWLINPNISSQKFKFQYCLENIFAQMPLPPNAHFCFFTQTKNQLIAYISLYGNRAENGAFAMCFTLGQISPNEFQIPMCFICDWQNKQEYELLKFIKTITHIE